MRCAVKAGGTDRDEHDVEQQLQLGLLLAGRIEADGTCQVWRGEGVWQSDSLNGIARRLFIAPGIVKVHLTHIFAKLGITTRAELAAQAAAQDLAAR